MAQRPVFWQKRVLVPFWVVRICIMLLIIGAVGISLSNVKELEDIIQPSVSLLIVIILFSCIVLLIDILAILLFLRDALKPGTFLTMNSFQTAFWGVALIMEFADIGKGGSTVGLGFGVFVFLSYFGLFVYSVIGYRRAKAEAKRGQYAPAHNPFGGSVPAQQSSPYNSAPEYQNTAYHSQTQPAEMNNQYLPPYQSGAATDYYQQPVKPAHIV
ncbi:hypothetical protein J4E91_009799 [Alternaria rosae]|uniref:uncharacterized protein n=1 Tax=Alternaria rosae TaxID=1187941 RepID=UPI001E8EBF9A|nr:uncharacterized protein BKA58DRAFT_228777 [Alternaria rosae]KAH6865867.1 hypothetical protein BKA58DRAFT_228777 [Alternaria rosae]KAI4942878.1 hypothetical protein J4E91_009799 [Alternaria rosae]